MDYAKVLARNLAKLEPKVEHIVRMGIDRIVFSASIGDMELAFQASGVQYREPRPAACK